MLRPPRFVGLLGWPLEHTLSPPMHNAAFRSLRMDWVYLSWPVPPEELEAAVRGLRALGATGANVTMPHKESVIEHLDELSPEAEALGAVNTIHRTGDLLVGHNTDVIGFRDFLTNDVGGGARATSALVLGSGGAARAVVSVLDELGIERLTVAARTPERGAKLSGLAKRVPVEVVAFDQAERLAGETDLVVNATPLGMKGESALASVEWRPGQVVCDLVYAPPVTPVMKAAHDAGAEAYGGLGMLIHQAAAAFSIWTGREAPLPTMSAAAVRALTTPS